MKKNIFSSCALLILAILTNNCTRERDKYVEVEFEFLIPLQISPALDTFNVGQEITLTADFSDSLYDMVSKKKYHLPNFNFKTVAIVKKLQNPLIEFPEQQGHISRFTYTNIVGSMNNFTTSFADVNFKYQNNRYQLAIKLIPRQAGVYGFRVYHSTGVKGLTALPQILAPNEPGIKKFPIIQRIPYIFNEGNTNFNIYKQHVFVGDTNPATNWVESKTTYTFVVR